MKHLIIIIFLGLFLGGCASVKVTSGYDPGADFSAFSSFNFRSEIKQEDEGAAFDPDLLQRKYIEHGITIEMGIRDYIMSNRPDLWITYDLMPAGGQQSSAGRTLIVEIVDSRTGKSIWTASAEPVRGIEENPRQAFEEAISAMFTAYPYLAGKKDRYTK